MTLECRIYIRKNTSDFSPIFHTFPIRLSGRGTPARTEAQPLLWMAMGGEPTEVRNTGGVKATKMEEEGKPLMGGVGAAGSGVVGDADVERALARFAQAAASSPAVSCKLEAWGAGVDRCLERRRWSMRLCVCVCDGAPMW